MNKLVSLRSTQLMRAMEAILYEVDPDLPIETLPEVSKQSDFLEILMFTLEQIQLGVISHIADLLLEDIHFNQYPITHIVTIHILNTEDLVLLEIGNEPSYISQSIYHR